MACPRAAGVWNRASESQSAANKLASPELQRQEFCVAQKNDLMCSVWRDTEPVLILSDYHHPVTCGVVPPSSYLWCCTEGVLGPVEVTKALPDWI